MFLIWTTYIIEIILLSILKPIFSDFSFVAIIATIIHVIFTIIVLLTVIRKKTKILSWAYLLRVFFLFFDIFGRDIFILPSSGSDSEGYYARALEVANNLSILGDTEMSIYSQVTGFILSLIGPQRIFVQYLNVLLGISAIYVIYLITEELEIDKRIQLYGLGIFSFMPNAIIMSSIFLREAFPTFFVSLSIFYFVKWLKNRKNIDMIFSLVLLGLASVFHSGVIGIIFGLGFAYLFYDNKIQKFVFSKQTVFYGIILTILTVLSVTVFEEFVFGKFQGVENMDDILNKASGIGRGGSVYLSGLQINSIFDFILFSPIKAIYFYISPLPWDWRGFNDIFTFLSDSMIYLITIVAFLFSKNETYKRKHFIVLFLLMIIGCGLIFGTGVDNAGTAMRHRQKLLPVFIPILLMIFDSELKYQNDLVKEKMYQSGIGISSKIKELKMKNSNPFENNIMIIDFFKVLKSNLLKITFSGILGLVIASILTFLIMKPQYSSTVDLVVSEPTNQQINQATIQTNLSLLNTYEGIIKKPNILERVIEDTGTDLTVSELSDATTVSTEDDSLLLSISVTGDSPYTVAELANSISENFVKEVQNILQTNNVFIWNMAKPITSPISPNIPFNLILGLLIGYAVAIFYYLIKYIYDPVVRSEDIIEQLGLTPLGIIPEISDDLYNDTVLNEDKPRNVNDRNRRVY